MNRAENKDNIYNRIFNGIAFAIGIVVVLLIILFVVIMIRTHGNAKLDGWHQDIHLNWMHIEEDGTKIPIEEAQIDEHNKQVYETILPQYIKPGAAIAFHTGLLTDVYINGKLRMRYDGSENPFQGSAVKNMLFVVPLFSSDCNATMRVVRYDKYGNDALPGIYYGDTIGIYNEFSSDNRYGIYFAIAIAIVALIIAFACFFLGKRLGGNKTLAVLCFGVFGIAVWMVFNNDTFQYLFNTQYIDGIYAYLTIMLICFPFMYYVNMVQEKRYSKWYCAAAILQVITFGVVSFLQFSDIMDFSVTLLPMNIVQMLIILLMLVTIIIDTVKRHKNSFRLVNCGLAGLAFSGVLEVLNINFWHVAFEGFFLDVGLLTLLVMIYIFGRSYVEKSAIVAESATKASKMKSSFLANMSHEIRTPINAIMGMNDMILREEISEEVRGYSNSIKSASNNLLYLINDILDFSKIEAGKLELTKEEYKLGDVVRDVVNAIRVKIDDKGLKLNIEIDEELPSVLYGDSTRVYQIMSNILGNAAKYTQKGDILFKLNGEVIEDVLELEITIKDTGIGIREEDKPRLFDKFERLDVLKNRGVEGAGLGLAIAKELISMMDGEISFDSTYGQGTTFYIMIRQVIVDRSELGKINFSSAKREAENKYIAKFVAPKANILIVDDNELNLMVAKGLLKKTYMNVDICKSGFEMLERVVRKQYHIILLDHMMPEMDGIETLRRFKNLEGNMCKDAPVIAMTANAIKGAKENYISEGFNDYISKPVKSEDLEQIIYNYLPEKLICNNIEEIIARQSLVVPPMEEFDLEYARKLLGNEEILIDVICELFKYLPKVKDKLNILFDGIENEEILQTYCVEVHALKSSTASAGALLLSKMARILERSATNKEIDRIRIMHPILIEEIEKHYKVIAESGVVVISNDKTEDDNRVEIVLKNIMECLEQKKYNSLDLLVDEMNEYIYPTDLEKQIVEIMNYLDDFEYESAYRCLCEMFDR